MKRIFQIIESNKVLFKNFTSLSILQISNYLFPLITLPYLVRVLGPEKYGLVSFIISFTSYFGILIDYGFNLSATKDISINRDNKVKLSEIFSSVFYSRIFLFTLSLMIFYSLSYFFNVFQHYQDIFILSLMGLLGTILFPSFFFQGIERMHNILQINFIIRTISVISIFVFIINSSDYVILIVIYSLTQIAIGFLGLQVCVIKYKIKLSYPGLKIIYRRLSESFNVFISSFTISVMTNSNAFILGLFADNKIVGYFAAADKIRLAFQSALGPLLTTTFSRVSKIANESIIRFKQASVKSFMITVSSGFALTLILFTFSSFFIVTLLGDSFKVSIPILKILSVLPFLYSISNFIGVQILIPLGREKYYSRIMLFALVIHTILSFSIVPILLAEGSAITIILTEFTLIIIIVTYLLLNKDKLFGEDKLKNSRS